MQLMAFKMIARIESTEFHEQKYYTVVTTPAPDAFSHPNRFKVTSDQMIGQLTQAVELELSVGGIVREKPYQDKVTRQPKVFMEAQVYLNVISSKPHIPQAQK